MNKKTAKPANVLQTVYTISGETLTPVHLGDGRVLHKELDFLPDRAEIHIFDALAAMDKKFGGLANPPDFGEDFRLSKYFTTPPECKDFRNYSLPLPLPHAYNKIRTAIKTFVPVDGRSEPRLYIPGTSLKGALRTAFMNGIVRHQQDRNNSFEAWKKLVTSPPRKKKDGSLEYNDYPTARELERKFFGKNPNEDLLRHLVVRDSSLLPLTGIKAEIFKARDSKKADERRLESLGRLLGLTFEAIPPGEKFETEMIIQQRQLEMLGFSPHSREHESLKKWLQKEAVKLRVHFFSNCRNAIQEFIQQELTFYDYFNHSECKDFYDNLLNQAKGLPPETLLLPLGWGSGWRGKTLAMLKLPEDFETWLRQRRKLRPEQKIYPITRKILMTQNLPARPLGWVKLVFNLSREVRLSSPRGNNG